MNHPNIVKYLGVFSKGPDLYLTMEYLSEGSLKDLLISSQKELLVADIIGMCEQAAAAMRYLEDMRVIHRDLALRNLLVTSGQKGQHIVKLADFGLSLRTKQPNEVVVLKDTSFAYR